jgi:DNA polymerase-3 subunit beta
VPYADFPTIPLPEVAQEVTLPGVALKALFSSVAACASTSSVRPELASLSLSIEGGVLTAVATDSFRLAEKKVPLKKSGTQGSLLVPAKNALDIAAALPDTDITIAFDEHQCAFTSARGLFVSRLTNAAYPDYQQIIPKETVAEATVLRKDFDAALRRIAIFSDAFQKVRVAFDPDKKRFRLAAKNADIGESAEALPARLTGPALELSFNHRYLAAVLGLTNAESLTFFAAGPGRPLLVKGVGDPTLLYLVSPMNQ